MICKEETCNGCFACYNICPRGAIKMIEDDNGFVYPTIDKEKCINCNLCKNVCPALNSPVLIKPKKAYAAYSKISEEREKSTSGGASAIFTKRVIQKKGVVYGACFSKGGIVNHIRITKLNELEKIKGSKYVHSYINNIFKLVKQDLDEKKEVLFIGTPCQVDGLKKFLMKDYSNLLLIDIICHGVPSQKYLFSELKNNGIDLKKISKVSFRGNDGFIFKAYDNNNIIYEKKLDESMYYQGFMDAFFYRENCYSCKYAKNERVSDITIGDFWGLSKESKLYDYNNEGVSVILPNTEKGILFFNESKDDFIYEERPIDEAIKGNSQLNKPANKPKNHDKFKKLYIKYGFEKACKKANRIKRLKRYLKKNLIIKSLIKKYREKKNG